MRLLILFVWIFFLYLLPSCQNKQAAPVATKTIHPEGEQNLTLYFIPSPFGINWTSPKKLFRSVAANYFSFLPFFMGHVALEVSCSDLENKQQHFFTGMTYKNMEPISKLLFDQAGLGVMFEKWPGEEEDLSSYQGIIEQLKKPGQKQGITFASFKISKDSCSRLVNYHREFKEHNIGRYYTLYGRPLYGEGAGCSAYGISFLEVAGLLNQEMVKAWSYTINLPKSLIGAPFFPENKVPIWKFFTEKGSQWGNSSPDNIPLFFWEPDKMHSWVMAELKNPASIYKKIKIYKTEGIWIDQSNAPIQSGPIWKITDRLFFKELLELNKSLYQKLDAHSHEGL